MGAVSDTEAYKADRCPGRLVKRTVSDLECGLGVCRLSVAGQAIIHLWGQENSSRGSF